MVSSPLEAAKRLAEAAVEAQAAGDHRRAARLYMNAVLALTGIVPLAKIAGPVTKPPAEDPGADGAEAHSQRG